MKKLSTYIALVSILLVQYSCKKQLNTLPGSAKVDGNVIIDQRSAEVALNGVYYRLAEAGDDRGIQSTMCQFNHEVAPAWSAGYIDYPYGGGLLTDLRLTSTSFEALYIWTAAYQLINAANGVIKGTEALPAGKILESRRKGILGEAKFLRAYGHYYALQHYGQYYDPASAYGILLRTEPVTVTNIARSRSTVQESYDLIMSDLDEAIANAPAQNPNYYATDWAAKALKARILMNRGAAGDYANALTLVNDIIQNSPYLLETNVKDIFSTKGLSSKEVILGIKPFPNQVRKYDTYLYRNAPGYIVTPALTTLLQNDPRNSWVIGNYPSGVGINKFVGSQFEVSYYLRLTEMYLLKSEAIVRTGGSLNDAKTVLKEVMTHAGVSNFTAVDNAATANELLIEIYKETVKNLLCEDGQEWQALLRLPFATVQSIRPIITSKNQYIMPIPLDEYTRNNQIGNQNPGYSW